jgi:hypothetical protein
MRDLAARRGVPRLPAEAGTELVIGPALTLEVLGSGSTGGGAQRSGSHPAPGSAEPLAFRLRSGDFSVLLPVDGTAAQTRALLGGEQPLASTVLVLTDRATRQPSAAALLRAASPELVIVQGVPRATGGAAPPSPVTLAVGDGEPEPSWHHTQTDGPLRLEVREDGYRVMANR